MYIILYRIIYYIILLLSLLLYNIMCTYLSQKYFLYSFLLIMLFMIWELTSRDKSLISVKCPLLSFSTRKIHMLAPLSVGESNRHNLLFNNIDLNWDVIQSFKFFNLVQRSLETQYP